MTKLIDPGLIADITVRTFNAAAVIVGSEAAQDMPGVAIAVPTPRSSITPRPLTEAEAQLADGRDWLAYDFVNAQIIPDDGEPTTAPVLTVIGEAPVAHKSLSIPAWLAEHTFRESVPAVDGVRFYGSAEMESFTAAAMLEVGVCEPSPVIDSGCSLAAVHVHAYAEPVGIIARVPGYGPRLSVLPGAVVAVRPDGAEESEPLPRDVAESIDTTTEGSFTPTTVIRFDHAAMLSPGDDNTVIADAGTISLLVTDDARCGRGMVWIPLALAQNAQLAPQFVGTPEAVVANGGAILQ